MGCDIHMYMEYRRKKETTNDYWQGWPRINPGRNYVMFGLLSAGVRYDTDKAKPAKGLPENIA